jgi:hypothetical protein
MTDDNSLAGPRMGPGAGSAGDIDAALDRVVTAARAHLAAIRAAEGERDDDAVWDAYVTLNNASQAYDELLNDVFGEVTPWDLEAISVDEDSGAIATVTSGVTGPSGQDDPYPTVVSVRQRRDYRVPSISALLRLAEEGRAPAGEDEELEPVASIGEAVLELLQSGDGSLGMLDVPELDPLDGVVIVAEVDEELSTAGLGDDTSAESDGEAPFRLTGADRIVGRLDERAVPDSEA